MAFIFTYWNVVWHFINLIWFFWEILNLEFGIWIFSANFFKVLMGLSRNHISKTPEAIMRSCTCNLLFDLWMWGWESFLNRFRLIGTIKSALLNELKQGMSRPGQMVNRNMFHSSLLLISRWWSIHGTEPHILSGICFSHGSSATQRLDNDVDLNKIKEIIQQDFRIEMERSTLYLITFYKMILVIFPSIKSCIPVTEWVQVTFKQSATFSQIAW